jgi:hypothetical protein
MKQHITRDSKGVESKEYRVWAEMRQRCLNPNHRQYHDYGGRGITIEWHSFADFIADMGKRPEGFSIERIDANGNYSPNNCKWMDGYYQNRNRRNSKMDVVSASIAKTMYIMGYPQREIVKRIGISQGVVNQVLMGNSFRDAPIDFNLLQGA